MYWLYHIIVYDIVCFIILYYVVSYYITAQEVPDRHRHAGLRLHVPAGPRKPDPQRRFIHIHQLFTCSKRKEPKHKKYNKQ